jgi:hypothetical protein
MRILRKTCASLALASALALGAGCGTDHTGIPASPPFDPIGTEPSSGGDGGTNGGALGALCGLSCKNIVAACGANFGTYCTESCLGSLGGYRRCEAEQFAYVACMATTQIDCRFGYPRAPECDPALLALSQCQNNPQPEL